MIKRTRHWPYYALNKDHEILISTDEGKTWQPLDETELNVDCTPLPEWEEQIGEFKKEAEARVSGMMLSDYLGTPGDYPEDRAIGCLSFIVILAGFGMAIWIIIQCIKLMKGV